MSIKEHKAFGEGGGEKGGQGGPREWCRKGRVGIVRLHLLN